MKYLFSINIKFLMILNFKKLFIYFDFVKLFDNKKKGKKIFLKLHKEKYYFVIIIFIN